jgi:hypothetical protein
MAEKQSFIHDEICRKLNLNLYRLMVQGKKGGKRMSKPWRGFPINRNNQFISSNRSDADADSRSKADVEFDSDIDLRNDTKVDNENELKNIDKNTNIAKVIESGNAKVHIDIDVDSDSATRVRSRAESDQDQEQDQDQNQRD